MGTSVLHNSIKAMCRNWIKVLIVVTFFLGLFLILNYINWVYIMPQNKFIYNTVMELFFILNIYLLLLIFDVKHANFNRLKGLNFLFCGCYVMSFCSLFFQWNLVGYAIPIYIYFAFIANSFVQYLIKKLTLRLQYKPLLPNLYLGFGMFLFPWVLGLAIILLKA